MSRNLQPQRLNMAAFAQEGLPLSMATPVRDLTRLAAETQGLDADASVSWQAQAEVRPKAGTDGEVWLYLRAQADVPLTCQRCMGPVITTLLVDQWYRFVENEDIAMAQDDESEEDLLVMEPQFDLLNLLEDELLMNLPVVPMHEVCPVTPVFQAGDAELLQVEEKPNPFAILGQLKRP